MLSKLIINLISEDTNGDYQTVIPAINFDQVVRYVNGRAVLLAPVDAGVSLSGYLIDAANDFAGVIVAQTVSVNDVLYVHHQGGQSLGTGQSNMDEPMVFTNPIANAYKFDGVNARSNAGTLSTDADVASVEVYQDATWQSPTAGVVNYLLYNLGDSQPWLSMNSAHGGQTIEQLNANAKTNALKMIARINESAAQLGKQDTFVTMSWTHGESLLANGNYSDEASALAAYPSDLRQLHDEYTQAVQTETGQSMLPLFVDQVGAAYGHSRAVALWRYTRANDDAFLACPKYFLNWNYYTGKDNASTDATHLNSIGYVMQGEYHAIAIEKYLTTGKSQCLEPVNVSASGNKIAIEFNVPKPPLVVDTALMPQALNNGFIVEDVSGTDYNPTMEIVGNYIILDAGFPITEGCTIVAGTALSEQLEGLNATGTNIRDSQDIQSAAGAQHTLYNWLVNFEHVISAQDMGREPNQVLPNYYLGVDPVVFDGSEDNSMVAGALGVITEVGTYVINATNNRDAGNTGRARFWLGNNHTYNFYGDDIVNAEVVVTNVGNGKCGLHQITSTPYAGTLSNIVITKKDV